MSDLIWHITECHRIPLIFALRKSAQCYLQAVSSEDPDFDTCEKWQVLWLVGLFFICLVIGVFDVLRVALKAVKRWSPRGLHWGWHTHGFDVFSFFMFSPLSHLFFNEWIGQGAKERLWGGWCVLKANSHSGNVRRMPDIELISLACEKKIWKKTFKKLTLFCNSSSQQRILYN